MASQTKEQIKRIVIHCSATTPSMDIGRKEIKQWHLERGYDDIGYHYVIRRDGTIEKGREDNVVGAHVAGKNTGSIGICLVGGICGGKTCTHEHVQFESGQKGKPENNFTDEQWGTLHYLVRVLMQLYPNANVYGHNEFSSKACPCFDVQKWIKGYDS